MCETVDLPDFRSFYEGLAQGLQSELQALRSLDAHSQDKGDAVEGFVRRLLTEHVPCGHEMAPGHVINAGDPSELGTKYDLVLYDPTFAKPLLRLGNGTCIFPYESVVGAVEVTATMDTEKMREDLERLTALRTVSRKAFFESTDATSHEGFDIEAQAVARFIPPRCFMFAAALETTPETLAANLQDTLLGLHEQATVSLMYIDGHGLFKVGSRADGYPIMQAANASLIDFAKGVAVGLHRMPLRPLPRDMRALIEENCSPNPGFVVPFTGNPVYPRLDAYFGETEFEMIRQGATGGTSQSCSSQASGV